jgi:hypothetical protein
MFRRAIFWGLTLMLIAVIVSLVVRSRREEKKQAATAVELVRESRPTATRVISPQDLRVIESKMNLKGPNDKPLEKDSPTATAHHQVIVRNDGPAEYSGVQLKFTYVGSEENTLGSRTCIVTKPIPPRQTESLGDIVIEGVPSGSTACITRILYADLK